MPFRNRILEAEELDTSAQGTKTGVWIHNQSIEFYSGGTKVGTISFSNGPGIIHAIRKMAIRDLDDLGQLDDPLEFNFRASNFRNGGDNSKTFRFAKSLVAIGNTVFHYFPTLDTDTGIVIGRDGILLIDRFEVEYDRWTKDGLKLRSPLTIGFNGTPINEIEKITLSAAVAGINTQSEATWNFPCPGMKPADEFIIVRGLASIARVHLNGGIAETNNLRVVVFNASTTQAIAAATRSVVGYWIKH